MFDECVEGGAFEYGDCADVFLGRAGVGPLRVAWDTNILIDYGTYGSEFWSDEPFDPAILDPSHRAEVLALERLMQLWMYRDIRVHVFDSQIDDAKRAMTAERRSLRERQVDQIAAALSCLGQGTDHWAPHEGQEWPESCQLPWMREGPDRSLLEQAVDVGCHVFLTRDAGILLQAPAARHHWIAVLSPVSLLDALARADELGMAHVGQFLLPDSHKWTHVMGACGSGDTS